MNGKDISRVIDSFYEVISGKSYEDRNWEKFSSLFYQNARLINFKGNNLSSDVGSYITTLTQWLKRNDFYEYGFDYEISNYGNIAQVSSRYEAKESNDSDLVIKSGRNLVQLVYTNGQWKILNMLWEDD